MRLTWPLTGRSKEMRLIQAAISEPDTSGIVICGAAGVGKSRIAREGLSAARVAWLRYSLGRRHILCEGTSAVSAVARMADELPGLIPPAPLRLATPVVGRRQAVRQRACRATRTRTP